MRVNTFSQVVLALLSSSVTWNKVAEATAIPPPTGPYNVGVTKLEIPYINTGDPVAPNNVTYSFIATAFYPTSHQPLTEPEPYLDATVSQLWEDLKNLTHGSLANLTTTLPRNVPVLKPQNGSFPTLLFGPGGWGPPTEAYTILLSDLASYGYLVIGTDHPYEQPFVRYPNGTGVYGLPIVFTTFTFEFVTVLQQLRVNETRALIDNLPLVEKLLCTTIDKTNVGAFGHSLGGAAAIDATLQDARISSGINIDGTVWGHLNSSSPSIDVKKPIMFLGFENHSEDTDQTWNSFFAAQTGWWRTLWVKGTLHNDWSDQTFWKAVSNFTSTSLGAIDGRRQASITRTLVRSFFDLTLKGIPQTVLDGTSEEWPEVYLNGEGSGTTEA